MGGMTMRPDGIKQVGYVSIGSSRSNLLRPILISLY